MTQTLQEMREHRDWREAFQHSKFTMDGVDSVLASSAGENDGQPWIAVFKLTNSQYGFLEAFRVTPLGIVCGLNSYQRPILEDLCRWDMTKASRLRLGLGLADLNETNAPL